MSGSIFDGRLRRGKGCPVCGATNTMVVHVLARLLNEAENTSGASVSRQASYCQKHGEALYLELAGRIGRKP